MLQFFANVVRSKVWPGVRELCPVTTTDDLPQTIDFRPSAPRSPALCGWLLLSGLLTIGSTSAEPFEPRDPGQVLERLRSAPLDASAQELHELRARLNAEPENLGLALQFARCAIARSRTEADPRYLGRAQAALAPWWQETNAPVQAAVLRATIRQAQHDFRGALADLNSVVARSPNDPQAWLTRATIFAVLGDYSAARGACLPLAQLAPGLLALTAAANVSCLAGDAERGCALLRTALQSSPHADRSERLWALTVLGEAEARLGQEAEAESAYRSALELDPRDVYVLGSYADLLLDQGRPQVALSLLKDRARVDGLLLRMALAEAQIQPNPPSLKEHVTALIARFEEGHLRGDFVHLREEARFVLALCKEPLQALPLAEQNWRVQHEPADARILLECAAAAHDPAAGQPAVEFIRTSRLQDVRLERLTHHLGGK